jgi:hypothetical protein
MPVADASIHMERMIANEGLQAFQKVLTGRQHSVTQPVISGVCTYRTIPILESHSAAPAQAEPFLNLVFDYPVEDSYIMQLSPGHCMRVRKPSRIFIPNLSREKALTDTHHLLTMSGLPQCSVQKISCNILPLRPGCCYNSAKLLFDAVRYRSIITGRG